jgi:hypothetical protein
VDNVDYLGFFIGQIHFSINQRKIGGVESWADNSIPKSDIGHLGNWEEEQAGRHPDNSTPPFNDGLFE